MFVPYLRTEAFMITNAKIYLLYAYTFTRVLRLKVRIFKQLTQNKLIHKMEGYGPLKVH